MAEFDPYYQWLGIPTREQPADYYRLLSIERFEKNPAVIENATDRQMAHVRTFQAGPHSEDSQRLLNELAAARVCLLTADQKAAYDFQLSWSMAAAQPPPLPPGESARTQPPVAPQSEPRADSLQRPPPFPATRTASPERSVDLPPQPVSANLVDVASPGAAAGRRSKREPANRWARIVKLAGIGLVSAGVIALILFILTLSLDSVQDAGPLAEADLRAVPEEIPANPDGANSTAADEPQPRSTSDPPMSQKRSGGNGRPDTAQGEAAGEVADPGSTATAPPAASNPPTGVAPDALDPSRPEQETRLAVPAQAARDRALENLQEVFQTQYQRASSLSGTEKLGALQALAQELYDLQQEETDVTNRFVLLTTANRIATESGDAVLTNRVIDDLCQQFQVDDLPLRVMATEAWSKMLAGYFRGSELVRRRRQLLELIGRLSGRADRAFRFTVAADLNDLAIRVAVGDRDLLRKLRKLRSLNRNRAETHAAMVKLAEEVEAAGAPDPQQSLTLGSYWCFELGAWEQGLPYLTASGTLDLAAAAELDLAGAEDPKAAASAADSWWELASAPDSSKYKDPLRARAAHWYALALDGAAGLPRKRFEQRIAEAGFTVDAAGALKRAPPPPPSLLTNSIGMRFKWIPAGEFIMGSPATEPGRGTDEGPQRRVRISRPFYLGVFEVTQQQYATVMGANPSKFVAPGNPVEQVTWQAAVEFCRRLSAASAEQTAGRTYRLPTEAEWEYACRAGTTTMYSFGDNFLELPAYAWFKANANQRTHPVGQGRPNPIGLYDMHGNVNEWCQDWHAETLTGADVDPTGPPSGSYRAIRGGYYASAGKTCRSAHRYRGVPTTRYIASGFRVALIEPIPSTVSSRANRKAISISRRPGKPQYTIRQVMKLTMKEGLTSRVAAGNATVEEKNRLLEVFQALQKNRPPKGEANSWDTKVGALVAAARGIVAGRQGATAALKTAANCSACHQLHKFESLVPDDCGDPLPAR